MGEKAKAGPPARQHARGEAPPVRRAGARPKPAATAAPTLPGEVFRLEISCPGCGGPVGFGEEDLTSTCRYCGSLLLVEREGREPVYHLVNRLAETDALRAELARYLAECKRPDIAERVGVRDEQSRMLLASRVEAEVNRLEERYRVSLAITRLDIVHAPYKLTLGELGQSVFGRVEAGGKGQLKKVVSFRVFALEVTEPGYDSGLNLRDLGLKIPVGGLRLLTRSKQAGLGGAFLRTAPGFGPPYERVLRLLGHAQDASVAAIAPPRSELFFMRPSVVYKPFLWVEYAVDGEAALLLVDGATGLVAGHPGAWERDLFLTPALRGDPLPGDSDTLVHLLASTCPVCGNQQPLVCRARLQICRVCHRALEVRADGIRDHSYLYSAPDPARGRADVPTWVPYWRFRFGLTGADGSRVASLAALLAAVYKDVPIASRAGDELYVPALRCLGHASLDQAFVRLAYAASHAPPKTLHDGPLLPDEPGSFVPATLTSAEARQVAPLLLYGLLDGPRVARLTRPVERRLLGGSTLHLDDPRLVLLPHASDGDALGIPCDGRSERVDRCYLERDGAELGLRQRLRISL